MTQENLHIKAKLLRFVQGKTSPVENKEVQEWLEQDEENVNLFLKVKRLWEEDKHESFISKDEISSEWQKVSNLIEKPAPKIYPLKRILQVAAAIVAIISITSVMYVQFASNKSSAIYATKIGERKKIVLEDGTSVWMNASSTLKVEKHFGHKNRQVELIGEAWFDVTKNDKIPFIVRAQDINVKVHGTQFNVNAYDWENSIVTTLEEGSISLYSESNNESVFLTPGEMGTFEKANNSITISKKDTPQYSSWRNNILYFNETQLDIILRRIENHYGVSVQNNFDQIDSDKITLTINNEPLNEVLNLLTLITNYEFELENETIMIK